MYKLLKCFKKMVILSPEFIVLGGKNKEMTKIFVCPKILKTSSIKLRISFNITL